MAAKKSDLLARWSGPDGQARVAAVHEALVDGRSTANADFGEVAGKRDLRGLPSIGPGVETAVNGLTADRVDLSYTSALLRFSNCRLTEWRWDHATLGDAWPGMAFAASEVVDCTFVGADLGNAALDFGNGRDLRRPDGPPSRYVRCDFTRTRFRRYASLHFAVFTGCVFDSTGLPGFDSTQAVSLYDCVFRGTYNAVLLGFATDPPPGADVPRIVRTDFSQASFEQLTFGRHVLEDGPPPAPKPRRGRWLRRG